jgi:hypothetical protein
VRGGLLVVYGCDPAPGRLCCWAFRHDCARAALSPAGPEARLLVIERVTANASRRIAKFTG